MNPTYTVRGADGREYGPVSLEQITAWSREGRIMAQNEIRRNDMEHWAAAGDFIELKDVFAPATSSSVATAVATPTVRPIAAPAGMVASGPNGAAQPAGRASWFYWIAGLSLINSVIALSGGNFHFFLGLGITEIFDGFASQMGGAGKVVAFGLDLLVAGVLVLMGFFATKGHMWAYGVGIGLLALDAVLILILQLGFGAADTERTLWVSLALHAYVLFRLFQGMMAMRELRAQSAMRG
jgi:hypothetical protein